MRFFKRIPIFLTFICCYSSVSATNIFASINLATTKGLVTTKVNDEIEFQLRQEIYEIKKELFEGIKNKDYDKVSKLISPKLAEVKNFDLKSFVNQASSLLDKRDFVIVDQYLSTLKKFGKESKATIVPSLTDKSKLIINNLTFFGKESYNLFLKSKNPGWQNSSFISLSKFNGQWKINIIHFGDYSINNLTPPKLYVLGNKAKRKNRLSSCVVYSWGINKFLRPAPYLQYIDEQKYIKFVKSSVSEMNAKFKFPFEIDGITIFSFQTVTTNDVGLIPLILYITDKDLKNPVVATEAKQLKGEILKKFYGLDHDFDYIIMKAYNEIPSDPKKIYNFRRTVIKLKADK